MLYISMFMIILLGYSFLFNSKYILNSLIILEMIMLFSMVFMLFSFNLIMMSKYMFLVVMTFIACEAALGLSMLISFVRLRGNNMINSLSMNCW
uniref:NADH dehydrogenase subunit 4L n=1 Tax=Polypylis sp. TS-2018 TaxID=2483258 RepID=UPI002A82F972|nr:NADH dehydrogenase subunit 4L [Polypylis sp. TS-2018]WOZ13955.1 NADH dehydrogenase subunit 4L [Polypylis sp. TS-2018]